MKQIIKKAEVDPKKVPAGKLDKAGKEWYVLQLFVAGLLPNSLRAIENIKAMAEAHFKGRYELEVVDVYQQPELAASEDIVALPVLIKKFPFPESRFIGDLSNTEEVIKGLHVN